MNRFPLAALAILALPYAALAAPKTWSELVDLFVTFLNTATGLLIVLVIVIFFWGIVQRMYKQGSGTSTDWGTYLFMGVAIIFFMVSIVGIIAILQKTLQLN